MVGEFMDFVRSERRTKVYTIQRMKKLWLHSEWGRPLRVISNMFLRKRFTAYITNSKIENKVSHIKHRGKFIQALERPEAFNSIK